jgi:hypothetical protein
MRRGGENVCTTVAARGEGLKPYGAYVFDLVCIEIIKEFNISC